MQPPGQPPAYGPGPAKTPIPGQNLAIAALACALVILVACFTKSWATWHEGGRESGGFGLSGAEFCAGDEGCMPIPTEALESKRVGMPGDVSIWGMLGMLGAVAGAAGAAALGIMLLTRKTHLMGKITKPTLMALGGGAFLCTLFLMRLLTANMKIRPGVSWGAFVGLAGFIGAGIVVQRITKMVAFAPGAGFAGPPGGVAYGAAYGAAPGAPMMGAPMAAPPMAAPPMAAPAQPCPRCQRQLVFVAQYQRWYCETCKDYA